MDIMQILLDKYNYNEPIFLRDVKIDYISEENIRQIFSRLVKLGKLERYSQGVYYIPKNSPLGKSKIPSRKVYERKFISDGKNIYGYYAGLTLQNAIGITTQVPNIIEIITNREKSRLREVTIGNQKLRLRKARATITTKNVKVLQLLELLNTIDINKLSDKQKQILINFIRTQNIKKNDVISYIKYYPAKVSKDIIESEIINEFTS